MKTTILLLSLFFLAITLNGCKDYEPTCAPVQHNYFYVKPEEKAVLPYKGFDTLKLKHSSGAEHTFYAGDMDSLFNLNSRNTTSPECPDNIIEHRQYYALKFTSATSTDNIEVGLVNDYTLGSAALEIKFRKLLFYEGVYSLPLIPPRTGYYHYDSLVINGTEYYNIRLVYTNNGDKTNVLYYNRNFGILKIVLKNGETWERIAN